MLFETINAARPSESTPGQSRFRMSVRLRQRQSRYQALRYALSDLKRKVPDRIMESGHMLNRVMDEISYFIDVKIKRQLDELRMFGKFLDSWCQQ